jgi:hypothetical protein
MKTKQIKTNILNVLLLLLLISCKNKDVELNDKMIDFMNKPYSDSIVSFNFEFPDTVYVNEPYNGKIKYQGIYDSIITTFGDKQKSRYIRFLMAKTKTLDYNDEYLRKIAIDTFGAINNRTIPLFNIIFTELGTNYIDGIINDNVGIDTMIVKGNKNVPMVHSLSREFRATHKVIVIEK